MVSWFARWADSVKHYTAAEIRRKYRVGGGSPTIATLADGQPWLQCGPGAWLQCAQVGTTPVSTQAWGAHFFVPALASSLTRVVLAESWRYNDGGWNTTAFPVTDARLSALHLTGDGALHLMRGTTELATSAPGVFPFGRKCWLEAMLAFDSDDGVSAPLDAGSATIFVDATLAISFFGQVAEDTQSDYNPLFGSGITAGANAVRLGNLGADNAATVSYRDAILRDQAGSTPPDRFGACMVAPMYPNGPGAQAEWIGVPSPNWLAVADPTPDDNATYLTTTTSGFAPVRDLYTFPPLPADALLPGALHFVTANVLGQQVGSSYAKPGIGAYVKWDNGAGSTIVDESGGATAGFSAWEYAKGNYRQPLDIDSWAAHPATSWAQTQWGTRGLANQAESVVLAVTQFVLEIVYSLPTPPPPRRALRTWAWVGG